MDEPNLEREQPSHVGLTTLESPPKEIKWNKEAESNLQEMYGKGSRASLTRQKKSARDLELEASKIYKLGELWKRHTDRVTSTTNSPDELASLPELGPINRVISLSNVPPGCLPPLSQEGVKENLRIDEPKDLSRLLKLVTEQEKKYECRLSPHSNLYRRHLMVQQFFQLQLKIHSSSIRRTLSHQIAQAFGRGKSIGRSIVRWGNSWIDLRKIPEQKERKNSSLWMYDVDVSDAIQKFA